METVVDKKEFFEKIKQANIEFVDLRFTDILGVENHMTVPVSAVDDELLDAGKWFDGSSFKGWQPINASDLILKPDLDYVVQDPFYQDNTLILRCDIYDPETQAAYIGDPRSIAKRAEEYLKTSGIASQAFFGPEPEFFIFDDVRWDTALNRVFFEIDSEEGQWNSGKIIPGGNTGHRPSVQSGYVPLPPVDSSQDLRSAISKTLIKLGIPVEVHHHEVGTGNQGEVATRFNTLTQKADETQILKYVVKNIAHQFGKTATFMPKPLVGENGSGMHCHQSLMKDGVNLFSGNIYAGLSDTALYYIGGIIRHGRALNALTNPTTNRYKRLVPGFEAPVMLAYASRNRSAAIRIPRVLSPKAARIEARFPDAVANPYLAFSAMLMAGLDGIKNKIHPGLPMEQDLYALSAADQQSIPSVADSLEQALDRLSGDHAFLLHGDVFSTHFIEKYIALRRQEVDQIRICVHPMEFELYYSA